jgi:hypothetical protein
MKSTSSTEQGYARLAGELQSEIVALRRENKKLTEAARSAYTVLTMIPMTPRDFAYMNIFNTEYITPALRKLENAL